MKSKTLALVTLLLVTAFLLMQAIAPHMALAGATWTNTFGGVSSYDINSLAYDSTHNLLYTGTSGQGVWKYDGTSWTDTGGGGSSSLAYDSTHNLLYAGGKGVWKYDGTTWTDTGGGVSGYGIPSLAYDSGHNLLYAGTSGAAGAGGYGVWEYNGTTWTNTGGGISSYWIKSLAYDSTHNLLYAGTFCAGAVGPGVWGYDGTTWTNTGGGVSSCHIPCLAYDSTHNLLYAGTSGHGVWQYDGATWTNTGGGVSMGYSISSLAYDWTHNLLYAGCGQYTHSGGVWKYDCSTRTWTAGGVSGYLIPSLAYDSTHNLLYAGTSSHGVWYYSGGPFVPSSTLYLAEGYTGPNFQEYLCMGNPLDHDVTANVTYMFKDGTAKDVSYMVKAQSRCTVDVNTAVGPYMEVSARISAEIGLKVERPMYFNYQGKWTGGHDGVAVNPARTWYFAEGTTRAGFDEWITVLNPRPDEQNLTFTYLVEGQGEVQRQETIGPHTRATFNVASHVGGEKDVSLMLEADDGIVAERPMYFDYQGTALHHWTGGHCASGAQAPTYISFFAEGTTRPGFEEWLTIQNPHDYDIKVNATYFFGAGQAATTDASYVVPAKQRLTVSVNQAVGPGKDVSIRLAGDDWKATFVAERPMYFDYAGTGGYSWTGGHVIIGTVPGNDFFAEGYTGKNFEEWICILNAGYSSDRYPPPPTDAQVTITYYLETGQTVTKNYTVPIATRCTIFVNNDVGPNRAVSAQVSSNVSVTVERPMYFNYNGVWTGGHDVVGF